MTDYSITIEAVQGKQQSLDKKKIRLAGGYRQSR
jgi:hypothetical protein